MTGCSITGCHKPIHAQGLCAKHWYRLRRHGDPHKTGLVRRDNPNPDGDGPPDHPPRHPPKLCTIDGCTNRHASKGLCKTHYARLKKHGTTDDPPRTARRKQLHALDEALPPPEIGYTRYNVDPCEAARMQILWTCVVLQAVRDAVAADAKPEHHRNVHLRRRQARAWLLNYNSDFSFVCDMAQLDPTYVRHRAAKVIQNHDRLERMIDGYRGVYPNPIDHPGTGDPRRNFHYEAGAGQ